jgi:hypothetical protein
MFSFVSCESPQCSILLSQGELGVPVADDGQWQARMPKHVVVEQLGDALNGRCGGGRDEAQALVPAL